MKQENQKKYKLITCKAIASSFQAPNEIIGKLLSLDITDTIKKIEIKDRKISFVVSRSISFGTDSGWSSFAEYYTIMDAKEDITRDTFIQDLKSGINELNIVFAKISLSLANITNDTLLGAIVTVPFYNPKTIAIED